MKLALNLSWRAGLKALTLPLDADWTPKLEETNQSYRLGWVNQTATFLNLNRDHQRMIYIEQGGYVLSQWWTSTTYQPKLQQNRKVRLEKKVKNKREREMRYLELSRKITLWFKPLYGSFELKMCSSITKLIYSYHTIQ